ncbi:cyclin-dependent kinase 4 inhibitor D [Platysternon megacephalum]|uniref:Cyclin-dependent kinase 4 inhibitor D n=1 Tax=Platysternon megacephalum TaxID=55544 RepID=A0A4D9DTH9_9SAUR|nr:cyclin-dependent kinase 4 inhibitor D [Platysternon megacephalum]
MGTHQPTPAGDLRQYLNFVMMEIQTQLHIQVSHIVLILIRGLDPIPLRYLKAKHASKAKFLQMFLIPEATGVSGNRCLACNPNPCKIWGLAIKIHLLPALL